MVDFGSRVLQEIERLMGFECRPLVKFTLNAGANTIKIGNAKAWAPSIDALTVAPTVS